VFIVGYLIDSSSLPSAKAAQVGTLLRRCFTELGMTAEPADGTSDVLTHRYRGETMK
jgi:hypothetical protein